MTEVTAVRTGVFRFPTPTPEADGTFAWDATTVVAVQVQAEGCTGLGWTYSTGAVAALVCGEMAGLLTGRDPADIPGAWAALHRHGRNLGTRGLYGQALSAVDIALWDLRARLLDRPLAELFGRVRDRVPVYGSGGFTTFDDEQLAAEIDGWKQAGCKAMKIKIGESWGTRIGRDLDRVRLLRYLAGDEVELMVDANGGYPPGAARRVGAVLDDLGVVWFEEPVSSDDVDTLAALRGVLRCDVAAGEYLSDAIEAARLAGAVDCLQLDVTRCGGYTGWLRCAAVAAAAGRQVSGHCAPSLHAVVAAAVPELRHVEWFADHARLEPLLVDGAPAVADGTLAVPEGPGHGMTLAAGAERWRVA
jgi:L-alanine-DL-glutamate epimerase-like enolase superfamily enzyme